MTEAQQAHYAPYLKLMRFPAVFTAFSNVFAGLIIAMNGELLWLTLIMLSLSGGCLLLGGMVLNDVFDFDEDLRDRPFRPLPAGAVPFGYAALLGAGLLFLGVVFAAVIGSGQLILSLCLVLCILFYNGIGKASFMGIKAMASCRYLLWLVALSVGGLAITDLLIPIPVALYIVTIMILSRDETTASDSRRASVAMCLVGVTFLAYAILTFTGVYPFSGAVIFAAAAAILLIIKLNQLKESYTPENIQGAITLMLGGLIPLDALILLGHEQTGWALMALLLIIPAKLVGKRLYTT